ncbi:MAG TPA: lytic transglycosylase domain-containing protein [Gemmatimonadaceae bacterium]|nr:lytic transglycosylase domain-containing protein [Gemmatimonadaceae bacterium]
MAGAEHTVMTIPESADRPEDETAGDAPFDDRRRSEGNVFTNVRRRSSERPPLKRWQKILRAAAHGVGASALLAAGVVWTVNHQQPKYVKPGDLLKLPASFVVAPPPVTEQVFRVSSVLRKYTRDTVRANTIATALVREGGKRNLDPALLVGLLLTENAKLDPQARSNVSARGLMQVMPFHAGKWKGCPSNDLADINSNICYGTSILADLVKRSPSLKAALQRYNGCVRGTNTPNCYTYSGKVMKYADLAASAMLQVPLPTGIAPVE